MGTSISSRVPSLQAPTMVPHPQRAAGDHRSHLTNGPWAKWHAKPWVWAYHGRILGVLFLYHGVSMSFIYLIENMLSNPSFKIFRSPTSSSTFSIHRSVGPPICNPSIKLNMSQGCVLKTGDIYIYIEYRYILYTFTNNVTMMPKQPGSSYKYCSNLSKRPDKLLLQGFWGSFDHIWPSKSDDHLCVCVRYVVVLSDRERDPQQRLGSVTPQLCKRLTSKLPSSWMLVVVYQPFRYHGVWGDCHTADPCWSRWSPVAGFKP